MVVRLRRAELHRRTKFGRNRSNRCRDMTIFQFFQDGGRPPSWICYVCVWTTHEEHLVIFIAVQNLFGIDSVVLIICMFFDFSSLAGNAYSRPQNWGFWRIWPRKWGGISTRPQKAHPWGKRRHMTYRLSKSVHRCDLCAWRRDQKRLRKKPNSGKLGIRQDHPRRRIEMKSCMVGGLQMIDLRFHFHQNRLSSFWAVGGHNLPIPIDLAIGLYNSLY